MRYNRVLESQVLIISALHIQFGSLDDLAPPPQVERTNEGELSMKSYKLVGMRQYLASHDHGVRKEQNCGFLLEDRT